MLHLDHVRLLHHLRALEVLAAAGRKACQSIASHHTMLRPVSKRAREAALMVFQRTAGTHSEGDSALYLSDSLSGPQNTKRRQSLRGRAAAP